MSDLNNINAMEVFMDGLIGTYIDDGYSKEEAEKLAIKNFDKLWNDYCL